MMCLFQTDTYLCGCPIKVSAFPQQVAGQRQSQPTSTAGEVCKTTLFPCGQKPCQAMYSKESVTEKRFCPKCDQQEHRDYSNTILMTEDDEMEPQAMMHASQDQTKKADASGESLPVLGEKLSSIREEDENFQQDYDESRSGIKFLRLL